MNELSVFFSIIILFTVPVCCFDCAFSSRSFSEKLQLSKLLALVIGHSKYFHVESFR